MSKLIKLTKEEWRREEEHEHYEARKRVWELSQCTPDEIRLIGELQLRTNRAYLVDCLRDRLESLTD